jgi:hypothetical protein
MSMFLITWIDSEKEPEEVEADDFRNRDDGGSFVEFFNVGDKGVPVVMLQVRADDVARIERIELTS